MKANKLNAHGNLSALFLNRYPGRGIVAGLDETGKFLVQVYWIMGRSPNSRNRIFTKDSESDDIVTAPADPSKIEDPSLIIYTAMAKFLSTFVVSNGHQTKYVVRRKPFSFGLEKFKYEPDSPNYTPRITAAFYMDVASIPSLEMSILKKSPFSDACDRYLYKLNISEPGLGYCITTYSGNGDPLPPFEGDPYLLPLVGDIKKIAKTIWENLNEENRVSLAVRFVDKDSRETFNEIINKYTAVV